MAPLDANYWQGGHGGRWRRDVVGTGQRRSPDVGPVAARFGAAPLDLTLHMKLGPNRRAAVEPARDVGEGSGHVLRVQCENARARSRPTSSGGSATVLCRRSSIRGTPGRRRGAVGDCAAARCIPAHVQRSISGRDANVTPPGSARIFAPEDRGTRKTSQELKCQAAAED